MTPTEFLQNKNIVAEDRTDLIIRFDNGTKESLIDLLEKYHQAKLKLLRIGCVAKSACQHCKGKGYIVPDGFHSVDCSVCNGTGKLNV